MQYLHHQWQETSVWYWTFSYAALQTSPRWPDPADLPSTTSAGSGPLTREAAQLLVQALVISCLDYCNSLLAGLPASAIKPLQRIQNTAARLMFNLPKFSHVTPLFRDHHMLPVVARIRFKMMVLAYKAVNGTAPAYLQTLVKPHTPARSLRSTTSAGRLVPPSIRARKGCSESESESLYCHYTK